MIWVFMLSILAIENQGDSKSIEYFGWKIMLMHSEEVLDEYIHLINNTLSNDKLIYGKLLHLKIQESLNQIKNTPKKDKEQLYKYLFDLFISQGFGGLEGQSLANYKNKIQKVVDFTKKTYGTSSWIYINFLNYQVLVNVYQDTNSVKEGELLDLYKKNIDAFGQGTWSDSTFSCILAAYYYNTKNYKKCKEVSLHALNCRQKLPSKPQTRLPIAYLTAASFKLNQKEEFFLYEKQTDESTLYSFDGDKLRSNIIIQKIYYEQNLEKKLFAKAIVAQEFVLAGTLILNGSESSFVKNEAENLRNLYLLNKEYKSMRNIEVTYNIKKLPHQKDEQ